MTRHNPSSPSRPVALFQGPRLRWFYGWPLVGVIVAAVAAGAGLYAGVEAWMKASARRAFVSPTDAVVRDVNVVPLFFDAATGTGTLPHAAIINVWLQNCADCMPAFEAWRAAMDAHAFDGLPILNVAYGNADASFTEKYRVDDRLVIDNGSIVVQPLGITSFTTLVVDKHGHLLLRTRPTEPGFTERVSAALTTALHYEAALGAMAIRGEYVGSYVCAQGTTSLTLRLWEADGELQGQFSFTVPETGEQGDFKMRGRIDPVTRRFKLDANEDDWGAHPQGYVTVDLDGHADVAGQVLRGTVEGPGCTTFNLLYRGGR